MNSSRTRVAEGDSVKEKRNVCRVLVWKPEGKQSLERTRQWWDILMFILKKRIEGHGVGFNWLKLGENEGLL